MQLELVVLIFYAKRECHTVINFQSLRSTPFPSNAQFGVIYHISPTILFVLCHAQHKPCHQLCNSCQQHNQYRIQFTLSQKNQCSDKIQENTYLKISRCKRNHTTGKKCRYQNQKTCCKTVTITALNPAIGYILTSTE